MNLRATLSLLVLPMFALGACATSTVENKSFLSGYGKLKPEQGVGNALVYEGNIEKLKKVDSVIIEDVKVIMPTVKEGEKGVTKADAEAMAEAFESALKKEFAGHYKVTSYRGSNTVAIRAALVQLKPHSPELYVLSYAPYSFVVQGGIWAATGNNVISGTTKMQAEMLDARSREQLYAIVDKHSGRKYQVSAGLKKWGHSELAFKQWARKMRVVLDDAKEEAVRQSIAKTEVKEEKAKVEKTKVALFKPREEADEAPKPKAKKEETVAVAKEKKKEGGASNRLFFNLGGGGGAE